MYQLVFALIMSFHLQPRKKICFVKTTTTSYNSINDGKFDELGWELLPYSPFSIDLTLNDYYLFSNAYFETLDTFH